VRRPSGAFLGGLNSPAPFPKRQRAAAVQNLAKFWTQRIKTIFPSRVRWELITINNSTTNKKQTMALNVKPIGDRILVEPVEEKEVKKGGIIIPDTAKEKPQEGIIVALGTGKTNDDGKKIPFEVKKGDRVLVSKYGGTEIKIDGKEYKILSSDDILAVLD
jgi:chaperonin GroES